MKSLLRFLLHPLHYIKWWHLMLAILVFAPLSLVSLRNNSETMGELKLAVVEADKNNKGIEEALTNLERYIRNHMNTSTEISLAEEYARDVAQAQQEAAAESGRPDLYAQAEAECNRPGVPGVARASCVQEFITARANAGNNPQPVELPSAALYQFDFVSPKWSPDLAGISIMITFAGLVLVAGKFIHKAVQ